MAERIIRTATPEEAARIDALAAQFEAEAPEISTRVRRMLKAEEEPGFRGEFRRAITRSLIGPTRIADAAHVDFDRLEAFRMGEGDLSLTEVEAIARLVGFALTQKAS